MAKQNNIPAHIAYLKDLTPVEVAAMGTNEFINELIENKVVKTKCDARLIILEALNNMADNDDDFPVHYYSENEDIPEENKYVECGECLTDDYIAEHFN